MSKGTGGRRTGRKRPHPAKNFSPSRLDIKKGAFPSPTVSDGRPEAQGRRSAGGRIGEKAGAVTRKVGRGGVAAGWFLRSSHRRRPFSTGNVEKPAAMRPRRAADAPVGSRWGIDWVTVARLLGHLGASGVERRKRVGRRGGAVHRSGWSREMPVREGWSDWPVADCRVTGMIRKIAAIELSAAALKATG